MGGLDRLFLYIVAWRGRSVFFLPECSVVDDLVDEPLLTNYALRLNSRSSIRIKIDFPIYERMLFSALAVMASMTSD